MKYKKKEWLVELAEIAILVIALMLLTTGIGRAMAHGGEEAPAPIQEVCDVR